MMLIIEENCVYEIDEECLKKRKVSLECNVLEKMKEYPEKSVSRNKENTHKK